MVVQWAVLLPQYPVRFEPRVAVDPEFFTSKLVDRLLICSEVRICEHCALRQTSIPSNFHLSCIVPDIDSGCTITLTYRRWMLNQTLVFKSSVVPCSCPLLLVPASRRVVCCCWNQTNVTHYYSVWINQKQQQHLIYGKVQTVNSKQH